MFKAHIFKANDDRGMVLVICLVLLLMLALIGIASITSSTSDMKVAGNELNETGAFYAAESGLERAAADIATSYEASGVPPNPLPSGSYGVEHYQYTYNTVSGGPAVQMTLTKGAYKGLYGLVRPFNLTSRGVDNSGESSVTLKMVMQDALIPLFQFAVFYENDLEIAPGPNMTLGGRVHSNNDIYLQSGNNLNIDAYLTSAGSVFHGRKSGSGQSVDNGNVFIKDKNNVYQNMKNGDGTWLDSRSLDWVNRSLTRWGGLVEDHSHGITDLNMPVVVDGPATNLIDRASGNNASFENKAGLKFVDGQAYYLSGPDTWVNVKDNLVAQGSITTATFYDARERKNVSSLDIDITKLNASGYYPSNGIIYASLDPIPGQVSAVRLKNGATLPRATTLATNNPLYTVGNFNTNSKKPAAIMADAVTILSGNWNDAKSGQSLDKRVATAAQINACFMTGNTETGAHGMNYNGGLENLPRFLEKWEDITLTWRGSMVDLWYSRQAVSAWSYGSYYTAPNRNWAFDPDLLNIANLPPGTPMVNIVQRSQWSQIFGEAR